MKQLSLKISAPYEPGHRFTMLEQAFRKAFHQRFGVWVYPKYDLMNNSFNIKTELGNPIYSNSSRAEFITGFCAAVYVCRVIDGGGSIEQG